MSAYLQTRISGNPRFGGFLSVDGSKPFAVVHDVTYRLTPGWHHFEVSTTPEEVSVESGAVESRRTMLQKGEKWNFDVEVMDGEMLTFEMCSGGDRLVSAPTHAITRLTDDDVREIELCFMQWCHAPCRSVKKIVFGSILTFCGIYASVLNVVLAAGAMSDESMPLPSVLIMTGTMLACGVWWLVDGIRKRVRRKK